MYVCVATFDVCVCVCTGNNIGDEGVQALSQCLQHLTQLTQLNLSGECCICEILPSVFNLFHHTI